MPGGHERTHDAMGIGLAAAIILASLILIGVAVGQQIQALTPKVGDIIAFIPGSQAQPNLRGAVRSFAAGISGSAQGRDSCTLQLETMMATGGSLIVEEVGESGPLPYRVHWAGGPTSVNNAACARNANLLVSRDALVTLAAAAGGFGVGDAKRPEVLLPDTAVASTQ